MARNRIYYFDAFALDAHLEELRHAGCLVSLSPAALSVLMRLVQDSPQVVSRDVLITEAWCGDAVTDGSLRQAIWEIRRALGGETASAVRTVRGRGYRFAGRVVIRAWSERAALPRRAVPAARQLAEARTRTGSERGAFDEG